MRVIIRWLFYNLVLLVFEEWGKAKIDMQAAQTIHAVDGALKAELDIFQRGLTALERLYLHSARAMVRFPEAGELIAQMLEERIEQLPARVNEAALRNRKAA